MSYIFRQRKRVKLKAFLRAQQVVFALLNVARGNSCALQECILYVLTLALCAPLTNAGSKTVHNQQQFLQHYYYRVISEGSRSDFVCLPEDVQMYS